MTVTGTETRFMKELSAGDAIIIQHPHTFEQETRIVTMVLSDISIGISSPFSSDLINGTKFEFIKKPKEEEDAGADERRKRQKRADVEKAAFGTYADTNGETITYRVRNPGAFGTYKIVTEKVNGSSKTRSDLLGERCKKKADRFCM